MTWKFDNCGQWSVSGEKTSHLLWCFSGDKPVLCQDCVMFENNEQVIELARASISVPSRECVRVSARTHAPVHKCTRHADIQTSLKQFYTEIIIKIVTAVKIMMMIII